MGRDLLGRVALVAVALAAVGAASPALSQVSSVSVAEGVLEPLAELCRRAAANCRAHVSGALDVEVHLVDFEGEREVAHS